MKKNRLVPRVLAAALPMLAVAANTASFDIDVGSGHVESLDLALDRDRAYVLYSHTPDLNSPEGQRLFLGIQDRESGELRSALDLRDTLATKYGDVGVLWPGRVVVHEGEATLVVGRASTFILRVDQDGTVSAQRRLQGDLGYIHDVTTHRSYVVVGFNRQVLLLDNQLQTIARWEAQGTIGTFAVEGDLLWVVEAEDPTKDGVGRGTFYDPRPASLRVFRLDRGLEERVSVPLPDLGALPKLLVWPDEAVVLLAADGVWQRCSYRKGMSEAECTEMHLDSRSYLLAFGTVVLQARRIGEDGYLLALPDNCGMWVRRYDRSGAVAALQPLIEAEGVIATPVVNVHEDQGYLVAVEEVVTGPRTSVSRIALRSFPLVGGTPMDGRRENGLAASCPAWYDIDFFAKASADEVAACIKAGADPNGPGPCGDPSTPPLVLAMSITHDPDVVTVLLDAGADPNASLGWGTTVLHTVVRSVRDVDVLARLLAAGANVNATDDTGWTPLHYAAEFDGDAALVDTALKAAIVDALLDAGANANSRNADGELPWDYAQRNEALKGSEALERLRPTRDSEP